jgi:hypothetical protein
MWMNLSTAISRLQHLSRICSFCLIYTSTRPSPYSMTITSQTSGYNWSVSIYNFYYYKLQHPIKHRAFAAKPSLTGFLVPCHFSKSFADVLIDGFLWGWPQTSGCKLSAPSVLSLQAGTGLQASSTVMFPPLFLFVPWDKVLLCSWDWYGLSI